MAGNRQIYRSWNLAVSSTLPIMGAFAIEDGRKPPDITVEEGFVARASPRSDTAPYSVTDAGLTVTVPGVACFACQPDVVRVDAHPQADQEMVGALLIATALPAAIWMRGDLLLHAAAVEAGQGAVGFLAPTGAGKSTLAGTLVRRGHCLVADDTVRVFVEGGGITVAGLPGCLWRREAEARTFRCVPSSLRTASAPLRRMVELIPGLGASMEIVDPVDAVTVLLRHRHRPRIPRLLGMDALLLPRFTDMARQVQISRWPAKRAALLAGNLAIDRVGRDPLEAASRRAWA